MELKTARIRGAIGIKKGMGLDEIEVDLSWVSGLVALSGQNGRGKTTVLESLSPFRTFASRNGGMKSHFFLRDSFRELSFRYAGDEYRTLVKVDSDSDRGEGFIWKNEEPQVNGKLTQYDEYITNLLGSSTLFYSSVFCAQNAKKLSDMAPGKLKELFVEFLRLDQLARYQETAKQIANILLSTRTQAEQTIALHTKKMESYADVPGQINLINNQILDKKALYDLKAAEVSRFENINIPLLQETINSNAVHTPRLQTLEENLRVVMKAQAQFRVDGTTEWMQAHNAAHKTREELEAVRKILANRSEIIAAAEKEEYLSLRLEKTTKERDELTKTKELLQTELTQGLGEISRLDGEIVDLKSLPVSHDLDLYTENLKKACTVCEESQKYIETEIANLNIKIEMIEIRRGHCEDAVKTLRARPISCADDNCPFIVSALNAQKELSSIEKQIKNLQNAKKEVVEIHSMRMDEAIETADMLLEKIAVEAHDFHKILTATMFENSQKLQSISEKREHMNRLFDDIVAADNNRSTLQISIDSLSNQLTKIRELSLQKEKINAAIPEETRLSALLQEQEEKEKNERRKCQEKSDQFVADIQTLESQIQLTRSKINPLAEQNMQAAKENLAKAKEACADIQNEITELQKQSAVLKSKLEEKEAAEKEFAAAKEELQKINFEISEWEYLKFACGKNGLQALEIDGVAPLITGYANELLANSFGPVFSVRLITQDENGKETLDIMVIREDGSETSLSNLSGGQKVWILKALRLAMTLVSKEKSGRNFQTFFGDEEDGALDPENALNFIGLYRSLMTTGDFSTCFYISHNSDVISMADHQLVFSDRGIEVN